MHAPLLTSFSAPGLNNDALLKHLIFWVHACLLQGAQQFLNLLAHSGVHRHLYVQ